MSKLLKKMVSEVINDGEFTDPSIIAHRINRKYTGIKVSDGSIKTFLENEYYPEEEARKMATRHRSVDGKYYI